MTVKKSLAILFLVAATIGSALAQAPASIASFTLRTDWNTGEFDGSSLYDSIDFFSNGTYTAYLQMQENGLNVLL
jgi:hypothetical protein